MPGFCRGHECRQDKNLTASLQLAIAIQYIPISRMGVAHSRFDFGDIPFKYLGSVDFKASKLKSKSLGKAVNVQHCWELVRNSKSDFVPNGFQFVRDAEECIKLQVSGVTFLFLFKMHCNDQLQLDLDKIVSGSDHDVFKLYDKNSKSRQGKPKTEIPLSHMGGIDLRASLEKSEKFGSTANAELCWKRRETCLKFKPNAFKFDDKNRDCTMLKVFCQYWCPKLNNP